jgi:anti-sigma factor ChrR (cupin superfamily)
MLEKDDLAVLDAIAAGWIAPVTPPAAVKTRLMELVRDIPQNSRTVRAHEGRWSRLPQEGVVVKFLTSDTTRGTTTLLMEIAPGATLPPHEHQGAEQTYVVSGSCRIGGVSLSKGDFHHIEAGSRHGAVVSDEGCVLLLVLDSADCAA